MTDLPITDKDFKTAVREIMPLVQANDASTPFIIFYKIENEDRYPDWYVEYPYPAEVAAERLAARRESDPYAVMFKGADFDGGDFQFVHDRVFCARLRAEYNAEQYGGVYRPEYGAVVSAIEDNIRQISRKAIDYLILFDTPLHSIISNNDVPIKNTDHRDGGSYDVSQAGKFIEWLNARYDAISDSFYRNRAKNAESQMLLDIKSYAATGKLSDEGRRITPEYVAAVREFARRINDTAAAIEAELAEMFRPGQANDGQSVPERANAADTPVNADAPGKPVAGKNPSFLGRLHENAERVESDKAAAKETPAQDKKPKKSEVDVNG